MLGTTIADLGKKKESEVGDGLLSHATNRILPSALAGLTAGFEMGPGGPPPLKSPTHSLANKSISRKSEVGSRKSEVGRKLLTMDYGLLTRDYGLRTMALVP